MPQASDLVQDAELQTSFDAEHIVHVYTETGQTAQERAVVREEHWKRQKYIGGGAYGSVWLEQCVKGQRDVELRAVKEVTKSSQASKKVDYARELEAISKFSHRKYERCFVKSFGWYETENAIFIAMEYFEHGDLHHLLYSMPPLSESNAQQITFQVLEGLHFMHTNGYAHRDLKPGNILVRSKPPDPWWIKLGDFGISKRAADSVAASSTVKGTLRYMAPELLDFIKPGPGLESTKAQAADMWALGEITFQMLTKEPTFKSMNLLLLYVRPPEKFPSDPLRTHHISETGIDFVKSIMRPKPRDRLTAAKALKATWMANLAQATGNTSPTSTELVLSKTASIPPFEPSLTEPSGKWSTVTLGAPPLRSTRSITDFFSKKPIAPASTVSFPKPVSPATTDKTIVPVVTDKLPERPISPSASSLSQTSSNPQESQKKTTVKPKPVSTPTTAKYYTIRAGSDIAIETSAAHGIWCCGKGPNSMLSNAFNKTKKPIFLIFSVVGSRKFCGVAQMKSAWSRKITTEHWETVGWDGGFEIEWLSFATVDFDDVKHLKHREGGVSIALGRFILELCEATGVKMMRRFGIADLVPPAPLALPPTLPRQQSSDLNSIGSLGVSQLGFAEDTDADEDADLGRSFEFIDTETQDLTQPMTMSSFGSVGDKRIRDEDTDMYGGDDDRRKRV